MSAGRSDVSRIKYFDDIDLTHCYDSLTDVFNRETMLGYARWLISEGRKFSFFLVDIDNFKNVNDTYGHLVGDVVLAQSAKYFVRMTEGKGVVGRYGGDEFMLIFDGVTDYNELWYYGHNIDMNIGGIEFEGIPNLAITVSMGIARCPLDADNVTSLMEVSDKALYRAKMKGRNCFIIYLPEKHAAISLKKEKDKRLTSMQMCFNIHSGLTACGEDISLAISTVFRSLVSYYMFDHICIECRHKLNHSVVFTLSKQKRFKHISYRLLNSLLNSAGYASISRISQLNDGAYSDIKAAYDSQNVISTLLCKISAYGKDYGFIRVDTCSTARMWQNTEIAMVMMAANTIGLLLHYQHKTLEELGAVPPSEAGSIE